MHAAITQSSEHAERTQLARRTADQYSAYCVHQHVIGALEHTLRSTYGEDETKWPHATAASIHAASQRADKLWNSYIDTESQAYQQKIHQSDEVISSSSTSRHKLSGGGGGDIVGYASPKPKCTALAEENGPHTSPYLSFYGRLYGGNMCNVKT